MLYTQEDGSYQEHGDAAVDIQQFAEHEVADHGSQPAEQHGDTHTQTAATKTVRIQALQQKVTYSRRPDDETSG